MPAARTESPATSWDPHHPAVWFSRALDPEAPATQHGPAGQAIALIRHPAHPFEGALAIENGADRTQWLPAGQDLIDLARRYVDALLKRWPQLQAAAMDLGASAPNAGNPAQPGRLDWLPMGWGRGVVAETDDPRRSFWVLRRQDGQSTGSILDRTAVLLAGRVVGQAPDTSPALGGDVGLRVVVHVAVPAEGHAQLRISGCSLSRLTAEGATGPLPAELLAALAEPGRPGLQTALAAVQAAMGFESPPVIQAIRTGRLQPAGTLRITGEGARKRRAGAKPKDTARSADEAHRTHPTRQITFMADVGMRPPHTVNALWTQERVGDAQAQTQRASNGTGDLFKRWMAQEAQDRHSAPGSGSDTVRRGGLAAADQADTGDIVVSQDEPTDRGQRRPDIDKPGTFNLDRAARSDARGRGETLFSVLRTVGLVPDAYFKLARQPLVLRNRARMPGTRDGQAINAEVRTRGAGLSACEPWRGAAAQDNDLRPQLSVRFGAAALGQRWQRLDEQHRLRDVQYLSLARDPHWAWHEFGHVLNYASIGEMEFRFAHSAGDALGAIQGDPEQPLDRASRFSSFPEVALPRRHDRQAHAGWCWCGRRSMVRLTGLSLRPNRRLGYFEEQLMSSALFRLYRSLGGDTGHMPTRRAASAHVSCLIMKAIALLGPDSVVPALGADHFVSALVDADLGLRADKVLGPSAGRACKVIRWAFEAQGLYATEDPTEVAEGPGQPPPVDLYIADRRQDAVDGGYQPVSLAWNAQGEGPWFAAAHAVRRQAGHLQVTVHNRGSLPAGAAEVTAWWWDMTGGIGHWAALGRQTMPEVAAAAAQQHGSAVFTLPLPANLAASAWVLVVVGCAGDPPFALPDRLPSLNDHHGLSAVVAHDNNVALARI